MQNIFNSEWITSAISRDTMQFCKEFAELLVRQKLTINQLNHTRSGIELIKRFGISTRKGYHQFLMLKPIACYEAVNAGFGGIPELKELFSNMWVLVIEAENNENAFDNFVGIWEATLQYFVSKGGRNG